MRKIFPGADESKLSLSYLKKVLLFMCLVFLNHFTNAQVWLQQNSTVTQDLKCLDFVDANIGYAGGENGTIIKTIDGGLNWDSLTTNVTSTIRTLFFRDQNNGWAGGDAGVIIVTSDGGANWSPQISGTSSLTITNIWFADALNGWYTGGSSMRKTIDGGLNWITTGIASSGVPGTIWGFDAISASNFWVCGNNHTLNHTTTSASSWVGSNATFPPPPVLNGTTVLEDIDFVDPTHGWVVGGQGTIYYSTTGNTTGWNTITGSPITGNEFLSIKMLDLQTGWACGRNGTITSTSATNGVTWSFESSGTTEILWEVDFIDPVTGFICGDNGTILKYSQFSSSAPLTLIQPNGGEIYPITTNQSIIWSSNSVANVKLEYSVNNGMNWSTILNSLPSTNGINSYSWSIPNNISCNALVRVSNASNSAVADTSDASFLIKPTMVGNNFSVEVTAIASVSPSQIQLQWSLDPNSYGYTIDRKIKTDTTWTNVASIAGSATGYTDLVSIGDAFEYRIIDDNCFQMSYGYIYAGLEFPETEFRGTALLLVDQNHYAGIANELQQYEYDLIGDGYRINRQIIDTSIGVSGIKNIILQEYANDNSISTVLTIGHLPAPYSGNFAPDGHAERVGSQPADAYYGDIDGLWTDNSTVVSNTGTIFNSNIIGDGKFDHSRFPDEIDLQVGRIDMNKMGGFSNTETGLIQQYLTKNHDFRLKNIAPSNRAIMNTSMDNSLPTTSASAWRSYSAMFGNNILNLTNCTFGCHDFRDSISTESYLWAHMAGGGSDTSMQNDVFTSSDCINYPINSIFMQMYGSYFAEWYKGSVKTQQNLLLRAPLASNGTALATVWSGKAPSWHFHHMALGETIGYCEMVNQNNVTTYEAGNVGLQKGVHMALMGDPTLKLHIVNPVSNIITAQNNADVDISWTASNDNNIVGYHVYRADSIYGVFTRINSSYIISTSYSDQNSPIGNHVYMVRAVKLENEASGSYYNLSTGLMDSISVISLGMEELILENEFNVFPNPATDKIQFSRKLNGIEIMNSIGEVILSEKGWISSISINNIPNGIYFIKSGNEIKSFVVQE